MLDATRQAYAIAFAHHALELSPGITPEKFDLVAFEETDLWAFIHKEYPDDVGDLFDLLYIEARRLLMEKDRVRWHEVHRIGAHDDPVCGAGRLIAGDLLTDDAPKVTCHKCKLIETADPSIFEKPLSAKDTDVGRLEVPGKKRRR